jgi:hypothetical protein
MYPTNYGTFDNGCCERQTGTTQETFIAALEYIITWVRTFSYFF